MLVFCVGLALSLLAWFQFVNVLGLATFVLLLILMGSNISSDLPFVMGFVVGQGHFCYDFERMPRWSICI